MERERKSLEMKQNSVVERRTEHDLQHHVIESTQKTRRGAGYHANYHANRQHYGRESSGRESSRCSRKYRTNADQPPAGRRRHREKERRE
jgi:hypothetical protein